MSASPSGTLQEGFVEIDGEGFYALPDVDRMPPFLMSIVSSADHWMFVSSLGPLTAGRRDATLALFPYETDDRLHRACRTNGPVTAVRRTDDANPETWVPFQRVPPAGARRNLYKSVVGNQVIFEEIHDALGLAFRYRWSNSDRFGFVRTATLTNVGSEHQSVDVIDGFADVVPYGLGPDLYQRMSNLTNAYRRSEVIDPGSRLAVFSLEARVVDRPEPAEALTASVAWACGLVGATLSLDQSGIGAFLAGDTVDSAALVTGRPGAFLLADAVALDPGAAVTWMMVADVNRTQAEVAALRRWLRETGDPRQEVAAAVRADTEALVAMMASADGLQRTGDRVASAHQFANVTYNVMRGGLFISGYRTSTADVAQFLTARNGPVASRHADWLAGLPDEVSYQDLVLGARERGDPQLIRLVGEYLPLTFGRRHGDPSRPWNRFSIRPRDEHGTPSVYYEGNWRDIFQNWEALAMAFPDYLAGFVTVFVNASTPDGFNPYRITRDGIDWEVPEPEDPWSNIGYWGDHQIVYLDRLIAAARGFLPGALESMLDRAWFSYADVPYRIAPYEELVRNPKETIRYDEPAAARSQARAADLGADGKLLWGADGEVHLVTLLEKLVVPALAKLSNYVPGSGIWMNTQRPEWNDANNALVGYGVSMVTLYHLRRYLRRLARLVTDSGVATVAMSTEVADWLAEVTTALRAGGDVIDGELTAARRKDLMEQLGYAFSWYRTRVYTGGFSGAVKVNTSKVVDLCNAALAHLDDAIARNQRPDGLYHSYNLLDFRENGVEVRHLAEMLEGQVAVLDSGALSAAESAAVIEALFASSLYRLDQQSFLLYPARRLPSFLEKNVVPAEVVQSNALLHAVVAAGDRSVLEVDVDGHHRFHAGFANAADLEAALDALASDERWHEFVEGWREQTMDVYEEVVRHREFTGRSGSMYGYEGIGSIYWHMVGKLLVAVQASLVAARDGGAAAATVDRLQDAYWRVRRGLGFNKAAAEYGAFPTDPYSHTPAHAGAQQPGMTGQVKEELLTRQLEVGARVVDGAIQFDPLLLRDRELLATSESWELVALGGERVTVEIPAASLGFTLCQVPIVVTAGAGSAAIEIEDHSGAKRRVTGLRLDQATSREVFGRTGTVALIRAFLPAPGSD